MRTKAPSERGGPFADWFGTLLTIGVWLRLLPLDQKLRGLRDVLVAAAAEVRDDELVGAHLRDALVHAFGGSSRTTQDSSLSARYRVRASFK